MIFLFFNKFPMIADQLKEFFPGLFSAGFFVVFFISKFVLRDFLCILQYDADFKIL